MEERSTSNFKMNYKKSVTFVSPFVGSGRLSMLGCFYCQIEMKGEQNGTF